MQMGDAQAKTSEKSLQLSIQVTANCFRPLQPTWLFRISSIASEKTCLYTRLLDTPTYSHLYIQCVEESGI